MRAESPLRICKLIRASLLLTAGGLLLVACEGSVEVSFAQPFPGQGADLAAFPSRHRAVYTAADSISSLCVGRTAVWRQKRQSHVFGRHQLDSLHRRLTADSTYQEGSHLHYLRVMGQDSVRDSWLSCDTIFTLTGSGAGKLRRFQGRYYLNSPNESDGSWEVQRLEIKGHRMNWQTLGQDTLRLRALDTASVHYYRARGVSHFHLAPATNQEIRRVSRYDGLWETTGTYKRR